MRNLIILEIIVIFKSAIALNPFFLVKTYEKREICLIFLMSPYPEARQQNGS